jgi:hypothetical protein
MQWVLTWPPLQNITKESILRTHAKGHPPKQTIPSHKWISKVNQLQLVRRSEPCQYVVGVTTLTKDFHHADPLAKIGYEPLHLRLGSKLWARLRHGHMHRNNQSHAKIHSDFRASSLFTLSFLGPAPSGTGTITLDPTFGSFTLLEPISH